MEVNETAHREEQNEAKTREQIIVVDVNSLQFLFRFQIRFFLFLCLFELRWDNDTHALWFIFTWISPHSRAFRVRRDLRTKGKRKHENCTKIFILKLEYTYCLFAFSVYILSLFCSVKNWIRVYSHALCRVCLAISRENYLLTKNYCQIEKTFAFLWKFLRSSSSPLAYLRRSKQRPLFAADRSDCTKTANAMSVHSACWMEKFTFSELRQQRESLNESKTKNRSGICVVQLFIEHSDWGRQNDRETNGETRRRPNTHKKWALKDKENLKWNKMKKSK